MRLGVWWLAFGVVTSTHAFGDEPTPTLADPWPDEPHAPPPLAPAADPPPDAPADPPGSTTPDAPAVEPADEDAASDDMIDPSELPVERTPLPYPRSFVQRPLLLPRGLRELNLGLGIGRETVDELRLLYLASRVSGRLGLDPFELYIGGNLVMFHEDNVETSEGSPQVPVFQRVFVGTLWRLPAETAIGLQGVIGNAGTRYQRYSPSLFVEHKFRRSERAAIYVSGGVDYNYGNEVAYYDSRYVSHRFGAWASGAVQLQVTNVLALQLSAVVAQYKYVDDYHPMDSTFRSYSGNAALLFAVGERLDLSPYVSASSVRDADATVGGINFTMR